MEVLVARGDSEGEGGLSFLTRGGWPSDEKFRRWSEAGGEKRCQDEN